MKQDAFLDAIRLLCADDAPRVWSLIVTIFGDLALGESDTLSGPVLSAILSPVGVRPEAMRVALFRLRNEGWIETNKRGREAFHALSEMGLVQSANASRKIYARERPAKVEWHLLCYPPALSNDEQARALAMKPKGYVAVAAGVYLGNGVLEVPSSDAFLVQGQIGHVPEWLSLSLAPAGLRHSFEELTRVLKRVELGSVEQMSPLQIATLRALIVHRWRKLVLRLPDVPDALFGSGFEGLTCRDEVMTTLDHLPRPALSVLKSSPL